MIYKTSPRIEFQNGKVIFKTQLLIHIIDTVNKIKVLGFYIVIIK
jgi:hypothetical protein